MYVAIYAYIIYKKYKQGDKKEERASSERVCVEVLKFVEMYVYQNRSKNSCSRSDALMYDVCQSDTMSGRICRLNK